MQTETTPAQYPGTYQAAIARSKKVLIAAGFPWSRTTGRYHPFASTKRVSDGVKVTRVGCSTTIAIHATWGTYMMASAPERRWIEALAVQTLRDAGMPFDDRGWLDCRY